MVSGAAVIFEETSEVSVSTFNVSDGVVTLSAVVTAVGRLRFGPVLFKTVAWRDFRPSMPVLPAKRTGVVPSVELKISCRSEAPQRPLLLPYGPGQSSW